MNGKLRMFLCHSSFIILLTSILTTFSFAQTSTNSGQSAITSESAHNTTPPTQTSQSVCSKPLIVAWTHYPPFQISPVNFKKSKLPTGVEIDLLSEISKKTGCTFLYQDIPFTRQSVDLKAGMIDLVFSGEKDATTEAYAYFSNPYRNETIHLFVRKNETLKYQLTNLSDIKNTSIVFGVKRGFYYGPEFIKLSSEEWFNAHIEQNVQSIMNLKKLVYGRIDGVFLEPVVERELEKNSQYVSLITMHPFILYQGPVQILFNKKNVDPKIVAAFNTALDNLQKEGKIKAILEKYKVIDNEH